MKLVGGIFLVLGAIATFSVKAKAIISLPQTVAAHDSATKEQTKILEKMNARDSTRWCVEKAQLRHKDWTDCLPE